MSTDSKLRIEDKGIFASSIFYAAVGIILLALLPMSGFPPHVGILGILSLAVAYGLFRKRMWALWIIVIVFLAATVFSALTIYIYFGQDLLQFTGATAYLALTWAFTVYTLMKRTKLET